MAKIIDARDVLLRA